MGPKLSLFPALALLLAVFSACGRVASVDIVRDLRENPAHGHYIEGVPFFPQDDYMCGPASLASVIEYRGRGAGMNEIAREVYNERLKGAFPTDLLIYAREKGLDAVIYKGGLEDLKKRVSSGAPLILFLNLGYDVIPKGHYIVVTGYSDEAGAVIAHSGTERDAVIKYGRLLKAWEKTGYSTILIGPGGADR